MNEEDKKLVDKITDKLNDENVTQLADTIMTILLVVVGAILINGISLGFELSKVFDWKGFILAVGTGMIYMLVINKGILHGSNSGRKKQEYIDEVTKQREYQNQLVDPDFNNYAIHKLNDETYNQLQREDTQSKIIELKQSITHYGVLIKTTNKNRLKRKYERKLEAIKLELEYVKDNGVVVKDFKYYTPQQLFNYQSLRKRVTNAFVESTERDQLKESFYQRFVLPVVSLLFNGLALSLFKDNILTVIAFVVFQVMVAITLYLSNYIKQKRLKETKGLALVLQQNKILSKLCNDYKETKKYTMNESNKIEDVPFSTKERDNEDNVSR